MQTIQINNQEIENFINTRYGEDKSTLLSDFAAFVKTEIIATEIKKGFDEVAEYEQGSRRLGSVDDFIGKFRSADKNNWQR